MNPTRSSASSWQAVIRWGRSAVLCWASAFVFERLGDRVESSPNGI
ncbi:MAG: hypothetical protein ACAF42_14340 [Limnothrix sp. BL-A-16]